MEGRILLYLRRSPASRRRSRSRRGRRINSSLYLLPRYSSVRRGLVVGNASRPRRRPRDASAATGSGRIHLARSTAVNTWRDFYISSAGARFSSCLPPLVVKLVSEPSCVRFLSSSAIVLIYPYLLEWPCRVVARALRS